MLIKAEQQHQEDILNYCAAEPVMNLFIVGDVELYGFETDFQDIWIRKINEKIVGVLLRYHDTLLVYSKTNELSSDLIMSIAQNYNIKSISGKKTVIESLSETRRSLFTLKEMYFAKLINAEKLEKNIKSISLATRDDARDIARAFGKVEEFKGIYSDKFEERYQQILSRIDHNEGVHLFIKSGSSIVSHGNTAAETSSAAMIGGLMTIEGFRRQGYASQILSKIAKRLIHENKEVCLLVSQPVENTFIGKLGFETVGQWWILSRI